MLEKKSNLPILGTSIDVQALDLAEGQEVTDLKAASQFPNPDPVIEVPADLKRNILVTSVDYILNWGRRNAVWPLTFGLACCSFEMIGAAMSRYDIARFGAEAFRATPRQADLMIVAGTLTWKMAVPVKRIYEQMADPKWVISDGGVCNIRRAVLRIVLGGAGSQPDSACGRVRTGLPTEARRPPVRPDAVAGKDQEIQHSQDEELTSSDHPA